MGLGIITGLLLSAACSEPRKKYKTTPETIYENRFQNVEYLNKMGANIKIIDDTLEIKGVPCLYGNTVKATDLRAGACLFLAGLKAHGTTEIENVEFVLRGY